MNLTDEQKNYITENVPNGAALIARGVVHDILVAIAEIMADDTKDTGEYATKAGETADLYYWAILNANT